MRQILLLLSVFLFGSAYAGTGKLENKTVARAYKAVTDYELLLRVSQACDEGIYTELAPLSALEVEIVSKLKITLNKFKQILSDDIPDYVETIEQISQFECSDISLSGRQQDEFLEEIFDTYEMALFNLEISYGLESAFLSRKENEQRLKVELQKRVNQLHEEAYSIAIGKLILVSEIPKKYRNSFINPKARNKYAYYLHKGWKKPSIQYVLADISSHEELIKGARVKANVKPGVESIFFINQHNHIKHQVPLTDSEDLMSILGETDWYWSMGQVHHN